MENRITFNDQKTFNNLISKNNVCRETFIDYEKIKEIEENDIKRISEESRNIEKND